MIGLILWWVYIIVAIIFFLLFAANLISLGIRFIKLEDVLLAPFMSLIWPITLIIIIVCMAQFDNDADWRGGDRYG